jgi:hypothetical protein
VAPSRKERRIVERHTQHWQLQAGDLAGHLRRHARIGQDLVEQAADHIDHHVVELAARGLDELFAVGADQVHRHEAGQTVVVLATARRPAAGNRSAARRVCRKSRATRDHAGVVIWRGAVCAGVVAWSGAGAETRRAAAPRPAAAAAAGNAEYRRSVQLALLAHDGGETAEQGHQLLVGGSVGAAA